MGKKILTTTEFTVYESETELNEIGKKLMTAAKGAAYKAYAPYSQFQVGAALLLDNDVVVTGNNQENACYPDGLCAERVAFFAAKSQYPEASVISVAVVAKSANKETFTQATPCGSCRQVMSEYEIQQKSKITLYMLGPDNKIYESPSIGNLLPLTFTSEALGN